MNRILSSSLPLILVIPGPSSQNYSIYLELATIAANNLLSSLRIDSELVLDTHMVKKYEVGHIDDSNLVILGGTDNIFGMLFSSRPRARAMAFRQTRLVAPGKGF